MMTTEEILEQVKAGALGIDEAAGMLKQQPFEDLGFAKPDYQRSLRTGFPEVVYCEGKEDAFLTAIVQKLYEKNGRVLGTRCSAHQADLVKAAFPETDYDPVSRTLILGTAPEATGNVAICCAGTADLYCAEEAARTAAFLGAKVTRVYDVGVAGLHRLLSRMEEITSANCVVAVAGMEGALASVVAGLVENPVIAVPTHVGYGASFHGLSALLTMINSCANGISVVNIDNGFGAGYLAAQINRLAVRGSSKST
jgi:NCAIR mutase (PurE)-related protein